MNKKLTIIVGCVIVLLSVVITALIMVIRTDNQVSVVPEQKTDVIVEEPTEPPIVEEVPETTTVVEEVIPEIRNPTEIVGSPDVDPKFIKDITFFEYAYTDALELASDLGFEFKCKLIEATIYEGKVSLKYQMENTDAVAWSVFDSTAPEEEWFCEIFINKYGSDLGRVYFTNGVPENYDDFYGSMFEAVSNMDATTDYVSGDTATIINREGEEITFEVTAH